MEEGVALDHTLVVAEKEMYMYVFFSITLQVRLYRLSPLVLLSASQLGLMSPSSVKQQLLSLPFGK